MESTSASTVGRQTSPQLTRMEHSSPCHTWQSEFIAYLTSCGLEDYVLKSSAETVKTTAENAFVFSNLVDSIRSVEDQIVDAGWDFTEPEHMGLTRDPKDLFDLIVKVGTGSHVSRLTIELFATKPPKYESRLGPLFNVIGLTQWLNRRTTIIHQLTAMGAAPSEKAAVWNAVTLLDDFTRNKDFYKDFQPDVLKTVLTQTEPNHDALMSMVETLAKSVIAISRETAVRNGLVLSSA